jgi:hypothetical protein
VQNSAGARRCRRRSRARLNYPTLLSLGGPCHLKRESHPSPNELVFSGDWAWAGLITHSPRTHLHKPYSYEHLRRTEHPTNLEILEVTIDTTTEHPTNLEILEVNIDRAPLVSDRSLAASLATGSFLFPTFLFWKVFFFLIS